MEDGDECFCGNDVSSTGHAHLPNGDCQKKCMNCGNWWKVSVYENTDYAG